MSLFELFKFHRQTEYDVPADDCPLVPARQVLGCIRHGREFDALCKTCLSVTAARGDISFAAYMRLCNEIDRLGMGH